MGDEGNEQPTFITMRVIVGWRRTEDSEKTGQPRLASSWWERNCWRKISKHRCGAICGAYNRLSTGILSVCAHPPAKHSNKRQFDSNCGLRSMWEHEIYCNKLHLMMFLKSMRTYFASLIIWQQFDVEILFIEWNFLAVFCCLCDYMCLMRAGLSEKWAEHEMEIEWNLMLKMCTKKQAVEFERPIRSWRAAVMRTICDGDRKQIEMMKFSVFFFFRF